VFFDPSFHVVCHNSVMAVSKFSFLFQIFDQRARYAIDIEKLWMVIKGDLFL